MPVPDLGQPLATNCWFRTIHLQLPCIDGPTGTVRPSWTRDWSRPSAGYSSNPLLPPLLLNSLHPPIQSFAGSFGIRPSSKQQRTRSNIVWSDDVATLEVGLPLFGMEIQMFGELSSNSLLFWENYEIWRRFRATMIVIIKSITHWPSGLEAAVPPWIKFLNSPTWASFDPASTARIHL